MFPINKLPAQKGLKCERILACEASSKKRAPINRCGKDAVSVYIYPDKQVMRVCMEHDVEVHAELGTLL